MTWKDKLEIGLEEDAPYRKDNPCRRIKSAGRKGLPGPADLLRCRWRVVTGIKRRSRPAGLRRCVSHLRQPASGPFK